MQEVPRSSATIARPSAAELASPVAAGATRPVLDVPTAINHRRQVRSFRSDPVPAELLDRLIGLTRAAPSSWNLQDWSVTLVREPEHRARLSAAAFGQRQIVDAPVTLAFVADAMAWRRDQRAADEQAIRNGAWSAEWVRWFRSEMRVFQEGLHTRGLAREYAVKDAMIAATHLVLAAESFGLATSIMNGSTEDQVKAVLGIAHRTDLAVAVLVSVGYARASAAGPWAASDRAQRVRGDLWGAVLGGR